MAIDTAAQVGEAFVAIRYNLDGLNQSLGQMRSTVQSQVAQTTRSAEDQFRRMGDTIRRTLGGAAAALGVGFSVRSIQQAADTWSDLSSRVGIAVGNMEAAPVVMGRIRDISRTTYSSLEQTAEAFARNASVIRELGRSSNEALDFTAALNNALVVSGAKGQRAATVQEALSRALAGGALRGQELNTVLQNGGRVAQALADGLGVSTLELRALGAAGQITSDRVIDALISQFQKLQDEAESMPATIEDGVQLIKNSFIAYVGELDKATGASESLAEVLVWVSDNMQILAGIAAGAAALGLIKVAAAAGGAVTAIRLLTVAIAANPLGLLAVGISTAIGLLVAFKDETFEVMGVTVRVGGVLNAVWATVAQSVIGTTGYVLGLLEALGRVATLDFEGASAAVSRAGAALRESGQAIVDSWRDAFREAVEDIDDTLGDELDGIKERVTSALDLGSAVQGTDSAAAAIRTIADEIRDVRFETMLVGMEEAGASALRTARALGLINDVAGDLETRDFASLFSVEEGAQEDILLLQRAYQDLAAAKAQAAEATAELAAELPPARTRMEELRETIDAVQAQMGGFRQTSNDALLGFTQGIADYALEAGNAYENMRRAGVQAMRGLEDAIVDWATTGKLQVKEMVASILADLARLAVRQGLAQMLSVGLGALGGAVAGAGGGGGAAAGAPQANPLTRMALGFASGGSFRVGGTGGVDSRLVQFKATPGEVVEVYKGSREYRESMQGGGRGGGVTIEQSISIDARGADAGVEQRIRAAMQETREATKAAVRDEARRSASYGSAFR